MESQNKMQPGTVGVKDFLATIEHSTRHQDALTLIGVMERVTGHPAVMWGASIIGFDSYHYIYESGREGDAPTVAFSPRKASLSLYLNTGFEGADQLLEYLGKYKQSKACLYINKLADIDMNVLEELISRGYQDSTSEGSSASC